MIELLKKFEMEDKLEVPPCSVMCMLDEDRKLLNRYRLNYFCITANHLKTRSKEDIIKLNSYIQILGLIFAANRGHFKIVCKISTHFINHL